MINRILLLLWLGFNYLIWKLIGHFDPPWYLSAIALTKLMYENGQVFSCVYEDEHGD